MTSIHFPPIYLSISLSLTHTLTHTPSLSVSLSLSIISDVKEMVAKVIDLAASDSVNNSDGQSSVVIICGTGYIMPDARCQLKIKEPR